MRALERLIDLEQAVQLFESEAWARHSKTATPPADELLAEALQSEDPYVRRQSARLLSSRAGKLSADICVRLIKIAAAAENEFHKVTFLMPLLHRLDSAEALTVALESANEFEGEAFDALWQIIQWAPLADLRANWALIQELGEANGLAPSLAEARLELVDKDAKDAWQELKKTFGSDTVEEDDLELMDRGEALAEKIAQADYPKNERLREFFSLREAMGTALEDFIVDILAKRGDAAATKLILERWQEAEIDGDEYVADMCIDALAYVPPKAAVAFAYNCFSDRLTARDEPETDADEATWERIASIFSLLPGPEATAALLSLADAAAGNPAVTELVMRELANIPTAVTLERAAAWTRQLKNEQMLEAMAGDLLASLAMTGVVPPEAEAWGRAREVFEHKQEEALAEAIAKLDEEDAAIGYDQADRPSQRTAGPAQGGPKAGRNDPCPCGSGQKYKKCCLAQEL